MDHIRRFFTCRSDGDIHCLIFQCSRVVEGGRTELQVDSSDNYPEDDGDQQRFKDGDSEHCQVYTHYIGTWRVDLASRSCI